MMKNYFSSFVRCLSLFTLSFTLHAGAVATDAFAPSVVRFSGHVPKAVMAKSLFLEKLDATTDVPLTFVLPLRNQEELVDLVKRLHDPADPQYGKYLSSDEFVERFAPTQEDYDHVIAYAKTQGLSVSNTHANRTLLNVVGRAQTVEKAFKLTLNKYETLKGRKFYAPNDNPEVPEEVAAIITGVVGLDNLAIWRPFYQHKEVHESDANPNAYPSGPTGGYAPADLLIAYNLTGLPADGTGQNIALFELAGYQASDINAYTAQFGLPTAKLQNVLVDGGSSSGIDAEVTLDIELALALAPQSQIYVYEGPNSNQGVLDTYNRIATDNLAKQVSTSWGLGEDLVSSQYLQAENSIFLQMASQGQTIYAAAGDSGAYDDPNNSSPVVDDPASQPYVVGVGGTSLTVDSNSGAYQSETCWDNGSGNGAGGGGVSTVWPIPTWQTNLSTAYSQANRNVPDVSLNADPNTGYSIYFNGQWTIVGGTSCAAPLWAAFTALVNQELIANQKPALGFANPTIYALANDASSYSADFHDVTTGNNLFYSAGVGYDNATGWGSFNGANLFASLTNTQATTSTTVTPPPPPSQSESPLLNITLVPTDHFAKRRVGTYQIEVSNNGNGSTSGEVSVAITLPKGLSYHSSSHPGWTVNKRTLTFTRDDTLSPSSSYEPILLNVNVTRHVPHSVTTTATVSGGGSASSTVSEPTPIK